MKKIIFFLLINVSVCITASNKAKAEIISNSQAVDQTEYTQKSSLTSIELEALRGASLHCRIRKCKSNNDVLTSLYFVESKVSIFLRSSKSSNSKCPGTKAVYDVFGLTNISEIDEKLNHEIKRILEKAEDIAPKDILSKELTHLTAFKTGHVIYVKAGKFESGF